MKKHIFTLIFILSVFISYTQAAGPTFGIKILNATTNFGINIPKGSDVFDLTTNRKYYCISPALSTENLTTAAAKFVIVPVINGSGFVKSSGVSISFDNNTYSLSSHNHNGVYLTGYTETDPLVSAWAKAASKPTYTYSEVGAAPSSTVSFPGFGTNGSTAAYGNHNHSGVYLTGYTETDPLVSAWAKAASKPTYTYSEVGAAPSATVSFPGYGTSHSLAAYGDHTHSGYLTSYTETDPLVSAWAKAASKPTYAYNEVGAPSTTGASASGTWSIAISGNAATAYGLNVHSARNNEANKVVRTDASGYIQAGYINSSSGNEGNNSNPSRVWGTNGSDDYLRTYVTGALSVNYANSAGSASYGRYVYDNGAISGSANWREASAMYVTYATSAGSATSAQSATNATTASSADLLDGYHASSFSLSGHDHSGTYSALGHTHNYASIDSIFFGKSSSSNYYIYMKEQTRRLGIGTYTPFAKLHAKANLQTGGVGLDYGVIAEATGTGQVNQALAVDAYGATTNYAIIQGQGNNFFNYTNGRTVFGAGSYFGNINRKLHVQGSFGLKDTLIFDSQGSAIWGSQIGNPGIGTNGYIIAGASISGKGVYSNQSKASQSQFIYQNDVVEPNDSSGHISPKGNMALGTSTYQNERLYVNGDIKLTGKIIGQPVGFATAVDTTLINTTRFFPMGYSQGFVIDTLIIISTTTTPGGTISVNPIIYFGTNISQTGTAVISDPSAVTTSTTAIKVYSFNNATIAKGNMIWLKFLSCATRPRNIMVQIIGHSL